MQSENCFHKYIPHSIPYFDISTLFWEIFIQKLKYFIRIPFIVVFPQNVTVPLRKYLSGASFRCLPLDPELYVRLYSS